MDRQFFADKIDNALLHPKVTALNSREREFSVL
jgi:hypothetical protein